MVESFGPVLLYDGECGFCRAVVRTLLRLDPEGRLRFAALQGRFAQAALKRLGLPTEDFDSLVFLPEATSDVYMLRTDGALAVLRQMGPGWRWLAAVAKLFPGTWRDAGYRTVARMRHRLYGRRESAAPIGGPAQANRFID